MKRMIPLLLLALCAPAWSQAWPTRPIRIVVPFPAGGATDTYGRYFGQRYTEALGQQVIVENRPGAGGNIGAAAAAQAAPDGYTLHFGAQTVSTNPTLAPSTAFDPVTIFEPIMQIG